MGVSLDQAEALLERAAAELYRADPRIRSVGLVQHGDAFGYRAVRHAAATLPLDAVPYTPALVAGVPVRYADSLHEVVSLVTLPVTGIGSPTQVSLVPEVQRQRPLVSGLQIQNYDDDARTGIVAQGGARLGTLGCFVRKAGQVALLSNNHVIAGQNAAQAGDRILQPGAAEAVATDIVATLGDFVAIEASPTGALPGSGVVFNEVDAGLANLVEDVVWTRGYLAARGLLELRTTASARLGGSVFKVGRTTGLTYGTVTEVESIVGPIAYDPGPCWFRRSFVVEGQGGAQFAGPGDSGSAVVRSSGEVIGLLYAGNGFQTYACPIDEVLTRLECSLA